MIARAYICRMNNEPPKIELSEREITRSYPLRPMNRGWFVYSVALTIFMAAMVGFFSAGTWVMFICGLGVGWTLFLCWPHIHLKKLDD